MDKPTIKVIGKIIGKDNYGYLLARIDHRIMPEFGALWVIDDKDAEPANRYFARVVDTTYAIEPGVASKYAKTLLDNPEMKIDTLDKEFIGYNFAMVDLLGVITEDGITDSYSLPSILAEIREPLHEEYELVIR